MKFDLFLWILFIFFVYSFIGWVSEAIIILIKEHRFVNRGITNGPLCTLYGLTSILLTITLNDIENTFIVFFASLIYSTIIQYLAGKLLNFFNKRVWWDFSNKKYNLEGYVCLNYSLLFGFLGTIVVKISNPLLKIVYSNFNKYISSLILLTLFGLLIIDLCASFITLRNIKYNNISKTDESFINWLNLGIKRRIENAYPTFKKKSLKKFIFPEGIGMYELFYLFVICANLGALIEIVFCRFSMHRWMSRSSIIFGQFSFVWGFAIVLITLMFGRYKNKSTFSLFIAGTILGGCYEYFCSVYTEIVYGTIFWDYSKIPFNLNGRINLLFCFFWGFATILVVRYILPFLLDLIKRIPKKIYKILAISLAIFLLLDLGVSEIAMKRYKNRLVGIDAKNHVEILCDKYFDNEFMKKRYSNMKWVK